MNEKKEMPGTAAEAAAPSAKQNSTTKIISENTENVNTFVSQAVKKLNDGVKDVKLSSHANAVQKDVIRVLSDFCRQNGEFAQAVVQSEKTVKDCIEATVKGAGNSISDFEVYSRAVAFWFNGATVHFNMTIDLGDGGFSNAPNPQPEPEPEAPKMVRGGLQLSLDELLGM